MSANQTELEAVHCDGGESTECPQEETNVCPQWRISSFKRAALLQRHAKKEKKQFDSADYFMNAEVEKTRENESLHKKNFPRISKDKKKVFDSADHFMAQVAKAREEQKIQQMHIERRNPLVRKTRGKKIFDSADYFMEAQQKH